MNARQKKLYLIQQKLRQSRKANQQAVVAEKRREVCPCLHPAQVPPVCVALLICCVQLQEPLLTYKLPEKAWPQDGVAWPLSCDDSAEPAEL